MGLVERRICVVCLELHSERGEERLDVGPDGLEVSCGLNIESNIQRVGGSSGELGKRFFDSGDQGGESGYDMRSSLERLVGAGQPLEDVLGSDFDSFFDIDQDVCHRDDSLSVRRTVRVATGC